ncbi:MAG: 30S ribosomal protein S13 [Candidatus Heimdallarchaeota archaeon]|nr:30S ribosomal protein S13 [Candidatus Heimdallarchaeota archaeon]MDH5647857.1 30S ribosomal protein S13 [Candidatus Heimdallarchaeota archaeon]
MKEFVTSDGFRHLVRIFKTDLNGNSTARNALTKITGINHRLSSAILRAVAIDEYSLLGNITEDERQKIEDALFDPIAAGVPNWMVNRQRDPETGEDKLLLGPDLLLQNKTDIDRMMRKRSWRGVRHSKGLKVRGQRTKSTGRNQGALGVSRKKGA